MFEKYNENIITLSHKIGIIIPDVTTQDVEGRVVTQEYYKNYFVSAFLTFFGGATCTSDFKGYYKYEDGPHKGETSFDNNILVYAYYDEKDMTKDREEFIYDLIQKMKKELKQECIGIELDGEFKMIF